MASHHVTRVPQSLQYKFGILRPCPSYAISLGGIVRAHICHNPRHTPDFREISQPLAPDGAKWRRATNLLLIHYESYTCASARVPVTYFLRFFARRGFTPMLLSAFFAHLLF